MKNYFKKLPHNAKQVKNALTWVTPEGKIYGQETRILPNGTQHKHFGEYFQYAIFINKHNGYAYCNIKYIVGEGKYETRQRRFHIILAEMFIPNPFNLPIVGHKNNIKSDNRLENLYWTTFQENTQKAFNDGLAKNAKGYEDSQAIPVVMFETTTNKELGRYGSMIEAHKANPDITVTAISRQCRYKRPVRKPYYFRFESDETVTPPRIVIQYDYFTDKEIGRYYNTADAAQKTGIRSNTIVIQCNNGRKPKTKTKSGTYFLYSSN